MLYKPPVPNGYYGNHFWLSVNFSVEQEDQSGGNSINYDVELFHHSEAHRDIYRAGYGIHARPDKAGAKKNVTLRWSSPKQHNLSGLCLLIHPCLLYTSDAADE